ncbi:mucin-22-like, partial [Penaeus vannamei]|uniref:mucin-22-like n=1 Tax=Penaeus vannamei TaxID=6689 RepID=UPI00387FA554
ETSTTTTDPSTTTTDPSTTSTTTTDPSTTSTTTTDPSTSTTTTDPPTTSTMSSDPSTTSATTSPSSTTSATTSSLSTTSATTSPPSTTSATTSSLSTTPPTADPPTIPTTISATSASTMDESPIIATMGSTTATSTSAHGSGRTAIHLYLKLGHLISGGTAIGISKTATRIGCAVRCSLVACQVFTVKPAPTGFFCATFRGVNFLGWSDNTAASTYFDARRALAISGNESCPNGEVAAVGVVTASPTHAQDCEWEMAASAGGRVVLVWVEFDAERGSDFVSISDPCLEPLSWIHYSGTALPPPFASSCDRIRLRLRTDESVASKGFVAALFESRLPPT